MGRSISVGTRFVVPEPTILSELWTLDNVLLSPHSADHTADAWEIAMNFFLENLARFRAGKPLESVVDQNAGY